MSDQVGGGGERVPEVVLTSLSLVLHNDHQLAAINLVVRRLITFEMEPEAVVIIESEATGEAPLPSRTISITSSRVANDSTLTIHSKRNERRRRKQQLKQPKPLNSNLTLLHLPFDALIQVLCLLRPSDNFRLARTCRPLHTFILDEYPIQIANSIIRWRYPCLEKCLRLPVPIYSIPHEYKEALLDEERLREWERDQRRRPYQHIKALDPRSVCRCLTCLLRWNVMCLAVDFTHWQGVLDAGDVLPVIARGRQPEWNRNLLDVHAAVVEKALLGSTSSSRLASKLWYAVILEAHLESTVRSIRRHRANKFNKRPHFLMTDQDATSGTDAFLHAHGPPSVDFPFMRDNYYMLEAYLPNRSWFSEEGRWVYMPAEQHEKDIEVIRRWAVWRKENLNGERKKEWTMQFGASSWTPTLLVDGGGPWRDGRRRVKTGLETS